MRATASLAFGVALLFGLPASSVAQHLITQTFRFGHRIVIPKKPEPRESSPAPDASQRESTPVPDATRSKVVCGMTIITPDPNIDPKILIDPRKDDTRYTIRVITPPVCK